MAILGYTLVLVEPGKQRKEFHLDPAPSEVRSEKPALTTLIPLPNFSTYRESYGPGIETVTLSGSFGYKTRQHHGKNKTGTELFLDFRKNFYDAYLQLVGSTDPLKKLTKVEFHNWAEKEHFYCEPMSFSTPRGGDNRTFFKYEIQFQLYEKIKNQFDVFKVDKRTQASWFVNFAKRVLEGLKAAGEWLSKKAEQVSSLLNRYVIQPLSALVDAIDSFVNGVTEFITLPIKVVTRLSSNIAATIEAMGTIAGDAITELTHSLRNMRRANNRLMRSPELFIQTIGGAAQEFADQAVEMTQDDDTEAVINDKLYGRNLALQQQVQSLLGNNFQGAERAIIREDDTLQKMALRYMGDSSQWHSIALLNGISDPDLADYIGDELLIPVVPAVEGSGVEGDLGDDDKKDNFSMAERLYGRDYKLITDSQGKYTISLETATPLKDIVSVGGEANLAQAVMLKTAIFQGQLLENRDFGLRRMVGKKATPMETLMLQHGLEVTAESDPRIASATVDIERDGNKTTATFSLFPVGVAGGRPVSAVVGV